MGGSVSRILSLIWSKKEIRILILGLVCYLLANLNIHTDVYRITLERLLSFTGSRYQLCDISYSMLGGKLTREFRLGKLSQPYLPSASTWSRSNIRILTLMFG